MANNAHTRQAKAGLPPGTLIPVGEKRVDHTTLTLIEYNADTFSERVLPNAEA